MSMTALAMYTWTPWVARAIAAGLDHPKVTAITRPAFITRIVGSVTDTSSTWEVGTRVLVSDQIPAM